jgi:hypothetical protein
LLCQPELFPTPHPGGIDETSWKYLKHCTCVCLSVHIQ